MAADSLGQYKVVVTADYTQLQSQFKAMTDVINQTTSAISQSLDKSFVAMGASMASHVRTMTNTMQDAFNGVKRTVDDASSSTEKITEPLQRASSSARRGAEGFKDYAARVREAEKAEQQFRAMQGKSILAAEERAIAGRTAAHKAFWEEQVRNERKAEQEKQRAANQQAQRIRTLQTQYRIAYEEINKYLQSHAKMSEAVFLRLQGRISAIGKELNTLGGAKIANPLAGMNYNQYASQFSKWNDFFTSFKHHITWMASAAAIGTAFAIPAETIGTYARVEKEMAAMRQVNHDVNSSQEVLNKTTQDFIGIAQQYGHSVDEIIQAGTLWGRQYKDLNEVMKLTNLSAKLAVADNMDIGLANRAVESVINAYQKQAVATEFATHVVDSWTKIAHNAQSSATDLAEALSRTGAAAKAVGVDFDTTNALASAMIKSTGRSGAEVGRLKLAA